MADIIISPLVRAVIGNLVSAATDEIKMLWGIEEEVDRLHNTLSTIGAVLEHAEEMQVTSTTVKNWLHKLKDVAYDAEDIVDDFATESLQEKLEGSILETSKRKQVSRFFSCLCVYKVVVRHEYGLKVKEVQQKLDDIANERHHFHLKISDAGRPVEVIERPKTGSLIDESEVIGRDDDKKHLIQILMTDGDTGKNISILPIVGMGGCGKTTLAHLLYNDTLIENHGFEIRAWVCVSDSFDVARITKEIIESATKAQCESLSIEPLQHKLLDILRGKKFIIVLDDVWNENKIQEWKNLCLPLKDGAKGSKIIVTTRCDKVAQMMGTGSSHKLGVLSKDDSWRLFEKMAFGGERSTAPQTLVNIGKQILRKCGGLPLAIKTMGGLLSSNRNESRWNNILLSKIWELPESTNDILPALRLSYQHLPTILKQCFTYCSLFPKDYRFVRDKLVQLWIAEGYIKPRVGMEMEEVGQDLFEDLLSRSFFQCPSLHDSRYFNMHDLVHDMAEFFSKEECVKIEGDLEELPESIGGLYNLQTLNLEGCRELTKLPRGITNLICLRHLQVDLTMQLPSGIGKLSQLVTLPYLKVGIRENECNLGELKDMVNLRGKIRISGLNNVSNKEEAEEVDLKNKEYLQEVALLWGGEGNSSLNDEEVLEGLQPPVNLRKLVILHYSGDKLTPSWLSKFDQMITFVNLVTVGFLGCRKCKSLPPLGLLPSLKKLGLYWVGELTILGDEFCGDNGTFPLLEDLTLDGLTGLEKWSGGMEGGEFMPCLQKLVIEDCPKLKQLPEKGLPISLKSLYIIRCPILEERCKKETGEDWPKITHIPEFKIRQ